MNTLSSYIYFLSGLIDNGLIQHGDFDLNYEEPVIVKGNKCSASIVNHLHFENKTSLISLHGYSCTDFGLDLYRLYEPNYNHISQLNFNYLKDMLDDSDGLSIKK
ncbi:MAG: hypothetical protein QM504_13770 [Pseudomonadota bacterium]